MPPEVAEKLKAQGVWREDAATAKPDEADVKAKVN